MSTGSGALANAGVLAGAILRRDRVRMATWAVCLVGVFAVVVGAVKGVYRTPAELASRAAVMRTATGIIFGGPGYGSERYTIGAMVANEDLMMLMLIIAIMSVLLVVRNTRAEEESGRAELVGAAATGRRAGLVATLGCVIALNAVIAVASAASLTALVPAGSPAAAASSWAVGAGLFAVGVTFTLVGAVTAQLAQTGRGAVGAGLAALAVVFLLRVLGDVTHSGAPGSAAWSWFSPLSWPQQAKPYVALRLWPLALFLPVVAALAALAARLAARRDLGAGLLRERAGRPTARPGLRGPAALTWRLQRGQWYGWGAGVAALALACGPIATQAQTLVSSNDTVRKVMAAKGGDNSAINGFTTVVVLYLAILAACAALNSLSGLASEESGGAGEALLARPISRARLVGARLAVATAGAVGLQLIGSALLAGAESASGASGFAGVFAAGASYLPALALFAAISAALFALAPKAQPAAWVFVSWSVIGSLFAAVLSLPGWTLDLAPLSATPGAPAAPITATPLVVMTVLAALLGALAMAAIRRRDYGAQT